MDDGPGHNKFNNSLKSKTKNYVFVIQGLEAFFPYLHRWNNNTGDVLLMVLMKLLNSIDNPIINPVLKELNTSLKGLAEREAEKRIEKYGYNEIGEETRKSPFLKLIGNLKNPLVILLAVLSLISYITGDLRAAIVMVAMVVLGVVLKFVQEMKADESAEKLKSMVNITAAVIRGEIQREIPLKMIVPGDIIHLASGDMIPADIQLVKSKDLFVNQTALTGESLPVEKMLWKVTGKTLWKTQTFALWAPM